MSINEEIRSRITYSVILPRLGPESTALIVRSAEGLLRRTRNLCVACLIEAVRDQTRSVDLKQVNRVLIQPHLRRDYDSPLP